MNSRTPSAADRREPDIFANPQMWIWSAVVGSVLICVIIAWLYFQQRDTMPRTVAAVHTVLQARIDLAQGLVLATSSANPAVASERERGLALLRQALSSIEGIAAGRDREQEAVRDLQRNATQFRERLARWSSALTPPLEADLRISHNQLERAADRVDADARKQLQMLLEHQRSVMAWALSAALVLVGIICVGVFSLRRSSNGRQLWRQPDHLSEARFRGTFEHAAVGIAHVAPDGRFLRVNQKLCDVVGYSREELQSMSFQDITHPQDLATELDLARRAKSGEISSYSSEQRYVCKGGSVIWANRTSALVRDGDGNPDYCIAVIEDIQKRKDVEAALRANEEWLRLALSASNQGLFDVDLRTWKLALSPEYLRMIGYDPDPAVPSYDEIHAIRHPDDQERLGRIYQEYGRGERTSHREELRLRTKTGEWIWVASTGQVVEWDEAGKPVRVVGTNSDINERKHAEQALAAERALLETLVDALPDVVFTKDTAGRLTMGNTAAIKSLGFSRQDELAGKTVFDLFPRELAEMYHADDLCALRGESVLNREEPGLDAEGNARWLLTIKVPLRNPAGDIVGLVGMNRDITDRKNADTLLRRTQKMEALGTLAGGIAHDFNNILLAINGNARLAIADLTSDHPAQASLSEIAKAGARAADLVRRILAFSRPEESRRDTMRLEPVIEEALQLLRSTLPAMTQITCAIAENVPAVNADASQIHQIMMNLITNAAHAIGNGVGLIEIRVDAIAVSADLLHTSIDLREGFYARLAVSDDGGGMDQATLERIFEPFFTTKPAGQGTGLGLSVVHGIMRGHGGAVTVYSQSGKGTTFHLYFPAAATPSRVEPREKRDLLLARGEHVLYVDDEAALVRLSTRALERLGYRVTGYSDPATALRDFQTDPDAFDAVVTDLSMPGMSGFELARAMLAIRSDIPLLMTSGYVNQRDEETARSIGVHSMILKPGTVDELGRILDGLFRGRADH